MKLKRNYDPFRMSWEAKEQIEKERERLRGQQKTLEDFEDDAG